MATIKKFKGEIPPVLKKGELATNGKSIYLKNDYGRLEKFLSKKRILTIIKEEIALELTKRGIE